MTSNFPTIPGPGSAALLGAAAIFVALSWSKDYRYFPFWFVIFIIAGGFALIVVAFCIEYWSRKNQRLFVEARIRELKIKDKELELRKRAKQRVVLR